MNDVDGEGVIYILLKLKLLFSVDSFLLQFIKIYLKDREQAVVVGSLHFFIFAGFIWSPQGSILGPTPFVLFLNDTTLGLDPDTIFF